MRFGGAAPQHVDEGRGTLAQAHRVALRAYRLYLAGSALAFEHGWIALHQILAARPTGVVEGAVLKGAQSDYPFNRGYMYEDRAAARAAPPDMLP